MMDLTIFMGKSLLVLLLYCFEYGQLPLNLVSLVDGINRGTRIAGIRLISRR